MERKKDQWKEQRTNSKKEEPGGKKEGPMERKKDQ